MFNRTVKRSLKGATLTSLILAGIPSCSDDTATTTGPGATTSTTSTTAGSGGQAGSAATTTTTTTAGGGGAATTTTTTTAGTAGTTGAAGAATTGGGGGGSGGSGGNGTAGGGQGGKGGAGGISGAGGTGGAGGNGGKGGAGGGSKDAGSDVVTPPPGDAGPMCTPKAGDPAPSPMTGYVRTGWGGQWTPMCNFKSGNGQCSDLPTKNAFDGKSNRTSLGDTHSGTAQVIGDTFTFDMTECHNVSKVEFYCGNPPDNGGFDRRDFPGQVEVTVSSDCTTAANGDITGTFTGFTPTLYGNEPLVGNVGCSKSECTGPFVINFPTGTAAKCIRMRLTKILAAGGGVWWAIGELYVK